MDRRFFIKSTVVVGVVAMIRLAFVGTEVDSNGYIDFKESRFVPDKASWGHYATATINNKQYDYGLLTENSELSSNERDLFLSYYRSIVNRS